MLATGLKRILTLNNNMIQLLLTLVACILAWYSASLENIWMLGAAVGCILLAAYMDL